MSMICRVLAISVIVLAIGIYASSADADRNLRLGTHAVGSGPAQAGVLIADNG